MIKKTLFIFVLAVLNANIFYAQSLDEELGFIYVKAEYLLETGRYDEAVTHYNQVVNKDPKYKDALVHRGEAKYALAAYMGAKKDAMQHIDLLGITDKSAALLGRAFSQLGQSQAAINSLTAAIQLNNTQSDYYLWRAQVFESEDMKLSACNDFQKAVDMGNKIAAAEARNYCGITTVQNNPPQRIPSSKYPEETTSQNEPSNDGNVRDNEVLSEGTQEVNNEETNNEEAQPESDTYESEATESEEQVEIDENIPPDDNTVNTIVIDDELSIMISGQALGKRKIDEVPSILILADETGKVALDVCIDKSGTVIKAEFNGRLSTIAKKSLVSLAMRKAREFEFSQGQYDMQCGIMVFEIKS